MKATIGLLIGVSIFTLCGRADATWLSGQIRNQANAATPCRPSGGFFYCPYVSDSNDFFGGDNTGIYVDYYQIHGSGSVTSSACRQSWTGGSYLCAAGTSTSSAGWQDVQIAGFSSTGTASVYDYFFVIVTKTGVGESIDDVIGFAAF